MAFHSSARRCYLVIGRKSLTQHGALNTVVEIYDSLANSWTQLQMTTRPSVNPQGEGVYSNGKFHWINEIHSGLMGSKYDVVAFFVESKEWELISLPHTPEERLQFWQLGGQDGNLVLIYRNSLCFWKLIEDTNGKTSKWSPLPRCLFDLTDDDKITQTCLQVAVNCSGWTLIYLPNKKMAVFDACGRTARKFDKRELSMLAEHGRCPTSVRGFETNNIWWPS